MTRIELVTSSLPRKRSTPELHRRLRFAVSGLKFQVQKLVTRNLKLETHFERRDHDYWRDNIHSLSGRPGSNRRHSAWKADALPTELLPQFSGNSN